MRLALVVLIVIAVVLVIVARMAWTKREPAQPQVTSRATKPPAHPSDAAPPPGSQPDREQKGKL